MTQVGYDAGPGATKYLTTWRGGTRQVTSSDPGQQSSGLHEESDEVARSKLDPGAFAPLYERYIDAVFGYCLRRTSDRELAADLTSQIFERALAALPRYQPGGAGTFRSWLFSIAQNLVVDNHRSQHGHASFDRVQGGSIRDESLSPEDQAIATERRDALANALRELTDGQRQIVELRLAGLTGPEIASVLGMHLAAVKSGQFRAYSRLRELLRHVVDDHAYDSSEADSSRVLQEPSDA